MNCDDLSKFIERNNLEKYRLSQVLGNYFSGKFKNWEEMTNLSKDLRQNLAREIAFSSIKKSKILPDNSGNIKAVVYFEDNKLAETVLMKYKNWITCCVSSQIGCACGCQFCQTGMMGLVRNLTSEEIVDQVVFWKQNQYPEYPGRIVFMGMGEPFLNWDNWIEAIKKINDKRYLGIGWRKMSVSTVGIIEGIKKLADMDIGINLAISLHSLDQKKRERVIPFAKKYPLDRLLESCRYYVDKTRRQVFFEYLLMDKINDSPEDAKKLGRFIRDNKLYFLNLINLNQTSNNITRSTNGSEFARIISMFTDKFSIRKSMGREIFAACGQLGKYADR